MNALSKGSQNHREETGSCSTGTDSGRENGHTSSSSNLASDKESRSSREQGNGRHALPSSSRRPAREVAPATIDHEHHHHHPPYNHIQGSEEEIPQRAWYKFDFAVVLALISPAGNWLTGGDHVKNLLFVALLVFYLHQIIEVPWELYWKARRCHQIPDLPPLNPEDKYRKLAISELRKIELLCLALTAFSPLIGASLLRHATHLVLGPESISWFSTGLFIMATGIRPWSHLIERLNQRTADLQDFIHYPPPSSRKSGRDLLKDVDALNNRIDKLERSLNGMKDRLKVTSEGIFDHVDDALDSVRRSLRKRQKQWDEQDQRVRFMEKSVTFLSELDSGARKRDGLIMIPGMIPGMTITAAQSIFPKWTFSPLQWFGGKFNHEPQRSPGLSTNEVAVPARLETIQEREHDTATSLNKLVRMPVRLLHYFRFVILLPFRLAIRNLFRQ